MPNTNHYRPAVCPEDGCDLSCADAIEAAIVDEGPETVAAVFLEPLQNAGGCFTPPEGYFARVREICDRYGVLLVSDEVICGFGRLGHWFGAERYGYQPDMITVAKGLTSGYSPLGGVIVERPRRRAVHSTTGQIFQHGLTFGGHPVELRGGAGEPRRARVARTSTATSSPTRTSCSARSTTCGTSRSSATCAAPGTSGRSSW